MLRTAGNGKRHKTRFAYFALYVKEEYNPNVACLNRPQSDDNSTMLDKSHYEKE